MNHLPGDLQSEGMKLSQDKSQINYMRGQCVLPAQTKTFIENVDDQDDGVNLLGPWCEFKATRAWYMHELPEFGSFLCLAVSNRHRHCLAKKHKIQNRAEVFATAFALWVAAWKCAGNFDGRRLERCGPGKLPDSALAQ
eukprot:6415221-Amphidinium_carterae.1